MLPVVGKLCRKEKMAAAIAAVPMVSAIFACVKTVVTEAVFGCCCNVLLVLVRNCPAAVAQFVDDNSPRAIYDGLYKYKSTEEVVGVACSLLHILLSDSAIGFKVLTLDDVTPMKDLMKASWDLEQTLVRDDVLSMGLAGLDALGNRYREEEKPLKRLGAAEVVEEVVHSFAVHSAVHARMALTALMFAAMTDKGKKSVVEKKGVQAEMEAIEEFAADKEVCSNGLSALALMSEVGAAQKVVTKYGVSSILSAMRRHKEEKEVQLYALKALNGLCEVREVSEAVGREGGIPAVVEVWRLFAEEEEMVKLGASVLKMVTRVSEATAASFGAMFYIGITVGRAASGFMAMKLLPKQMVRLGQALLALGCVLMMIPAGSTLSGIGLVVCGLGCAPIYPNIIQDTPVNYGAENSQAAIGVQMAFAYVGSTFLPSIFGALAGVGGYGWMPYFAMGICAMMAVLFNIQKKIVETKVKTD